MSVRISLVSLENFSTLVLKSSMSVSVVPSEFTVIASGLDLRIKTGARGGLLAGYCVPGRRVVLSDEASSKSKSAPS